MGARGHARPATVRTALSRAWALFRCSHPEPVVAVTALASMLALSAGRGPGTLWLTGAILTGHLAVGWSNDWLDRERDHLAGRRDKPLSTGTLSPAVVGAAALVALAACIPLSFVYGAGAALAHLAALACAFLYNARLKFTPASVLPFAIAFGLLPYVVTLGLVPPRFAPPWAAATGALLGSAGHFTQTLADIPADRKLGIAGLPQRLGRPGSAVAAAVLLAIAMVFITFGPGSPSALDLAGLALVALLTLSVAGAARWGRWRLAFRLTLLAAGVAVVAFVLGGRTL